MDPLQVRWIACARPGVITSASASIYAALINAFFSAWVIRLIRALAALLNFMRSPSCVRDHSRLPIQPNPNAAGAVGFDLQVLRLGRHRSAHWQSTIVEIIHAAAGV